MAEGGAFDNPWVDDMIDHDGDDDVDVNDDSDEEKEEKKKEKEEVNSTEPYQPGSSSTLSWWRTTSHAHNASRTERTSRNLF